MASDAKRSREEAATPEHDMVPVDVPEVDVKSRSWLDETLPPRAQARFRDSLFMKKVTASPVLTAALTFLAGGTCIRFFCNPATFRRRVTILGVHTGVVWWTQKRNNSTALFWNTVENIQASGDPLAEVRKGGQFANEFLLCLPILANVDPNFHVKCFKATMSQATDEAGQKYLVEEERGCRDLSLTDRLSHKYRTFWSSPKTRACIAGVLKAHIAKLSLSGDIPDEDIRRCASHIADTTENESVISYYTDWYGRAYTVALTAGLFFSKPWILRPAALTGIAALCGFITNYGHRTQVLSEPTRYSTPDIGVLLHLAWMSWIDSDIPQPQNRKTS